MNFEKRVCEVIGTILELVPREERESKIHVPSLIEGMVAGYYPQRFLQLFEVEYLLCGDDPRELGLAVFFDKDFHEIIRVEFEGDSTGIHCWFVDKQE